MRSAFTPDAHFDQAELPELVGVAIRTMDNTIYASGFPLEQQQRQEALAKRRSGQAIGPDESATLLTAPQPALRREMCLSIVRP